MKKIVLTIIAVLFTASLVFAQWQIDEGFEGGAIPAGWSNPTPAWGVYAVPGYPHSGDYLAASAAFENSWLITPQVSIQSGDSFIFWTRAWNGTESFNVKLSTTGTAIGDFTTTLGTYSGVGETWVEYSYDLSSYTGSAYLAIEVIDGGDYCLALDDVLVGQEPVSCPAPSFLNATNILETQADFGWTENGTATTWNIEVGALGFTPGISSYVQAYTGVTSNPYTGTGLTAGTNYDFYVQADCGAKETSTWAGPEAFSTPSAPSGLSTGDIAFTAMNVDGDDDFAIVALADIPANATFYFTDNEPNAAGSGFLDFNEGTLQWETGGSVISAGTVVVFTDVDAGGNALFGASVGTLSIPSFDAGLNLSGGGDALYAVEGSPEFDGITVWLAGIQNEANNQGSNFSATGLTVGTTFIDMWTGSASPDGGFYSGERGTQSSFSAYLPLLGTYSNWTIESSNGENILPISTEAFSTFSGPENPASFTAAAASTSEIDLDWTQNGSSDNVLVAWNSDGTFGTPINGTTYSAGNPITGGGTVLYYGSALLHYDHTSLTDDTPYYYRAWSYDGSEYSYGITDDATTQYIPFTSPFSENFDSVTEPDLPLHWSYLEISPSTYGSVGTYELLTWCLSTPNIMKMYKINVADDLLLITPQLGDLTSQSNQIRFQGRASGWSQDLIIGAMSDPTNETTFTAVQTVTLIVTGGVSVWEEYTVVFDDESSYNGTDQYIAFKQGADATYRTLYIEDFVYEAIPSPIPDPPIAAAATTDGTLTFSANWNASAGATGYYLDVATDAGFTAFLAGYEDLDVGNVTTYSVTALSAVNHYYRLRAYNAGGTSGNSNVITVLGSTLPVELSAFTASYMENYTLIKWVTASETDVIGFNIYRSTEDVYDTSVKLNINHIQGQGTTTEPQYYEFQDIDQLVYETTYYYWLEVVNYCGSSNVYGSIEFTPETGQGGFENDFDSNLLMNQPNPFSSTTTINYAIKGMLKSEPVNISIYNTLGQLILTDVAKNGVYQFDASELPTGVYFYRLETESYSNINKMMIIR